MSTITEGLAELKTLRKRIDKKRESIGQYIARAEAVRDPLEKQGGSEKHIREERQAVDQLEANYVDLRRRIALANDTTIVTLLGEARPISDWLIWRREIAPARKAWLASLRTGIKQLRDNTQKRVSPISGRRLLVKATILETIMQPYYVASLRGSGWFSRASQFNTDIKEAKEFYYEEALAICRRYKSTGHICVPVKKMDMEAI